MEDILSPYYKKAMTYEINEATGIFNYSIHPCGHSKLFLKIIQNLKENNEQFDKFKIILVFLKIIQEIIPTIEFSYLLG